MVFPSQVLSLLGRLATEPPGSAHSRIFTREFGVKTEFGLMETETDSPSCRSVLGETVRVGVEAPAGAEPDSSVTNGRPNVAAARHTSHADRLDLPCRDVITCASSPTTG
jgi:hypothetical protein